ncbi:MAG: 23S rRNA (uracil(1939)-C(5))-methyltransferase RlmD [Bacteroidota bacterium]|nr:23S rRNA (uracil(1939)-C(5))-methyltransferase RlmD [Bacteroidota bacterium]
MKVKRPNKIVEGVMIIDTSSEGLAVARVDDMVVFVEGAVPGDVCTIQIYRIKKKFGEAKVVKLEQASPNRIEATCQHFGTCGGCKWQHLDYTAQLGFKQKHVIDSLTRIGKVEFPQPAPIIGSKKQYEYRNKLEFTFSSKKWLTVEEIQSGENFEGDRNALGFHIPGLFDKIIDIEKCHLQADPSNQIRNEVRKFAQEHGYSFMDIKAKEGFLRNLLIRTTSTGELMVVLQTFTEDKEKREALLEHLKNTFPQITSLLYVINPKGNETFHDLDLHCYYGRDHIFEEMEGLKFKIGPKSFYQTNSEQAHELYKVTREFAGLTGNETVYDLYTGTGTIACFVAKYAKKVIGVEYVEAAIHDAKINAEINGLKNTSFYAGDMKDVLSHDFIAKNGKPDVIITDPPRAGMHEDVVKVICEAAPEKVVYVSCNPATQARDLAAMDHMYKVTKVQAVDMFPQTHHVENVVLLELRNKTL